MRLKQLRQCIFLCVLVLFSASLFLGGCSSKTFEDTDESNLEENTPSTIKMASETQQATETHQDSETQNLMIYIPSQYEGMDFNDSNSEWCYERSRESEHFVVFWASEFGLDPSSDSVPVDMRVEIDELLSQLEHYYAYYVNELGFGSNTPENNSENTPENSYLNIYKMNIFLYYQEEWMALGAGEDDVIGTMWVNPTTCQPVGQVIAHELGHCFEYQVYCDQLLNNDTDGFTAFRYSYEGGYGNTFWEQTAEWMGMQLYPEEAYTWYYEDLWYAHCNRSIENEWSRYQSYWFMYALDDLYGADSISRIWNEVCNGEDALATVLHLFCQDDKATLNEMLFYYASHTATFDYDVVRDYRYLWEGSYSTELYSTEDGYQQVSYDSCPDIGGFNVINLDDYIFEGNTLSVDFVSLPMGSALNPQDIGYIREGEEGEAVSAVRASTYNTAAIENGVISSHTYGFVAVLEDGSRVYSYGDKFTIPEGTTELYLVVVGTIGGEYIPHAWDDNQYTDVQLPYMFRISE